MRCLADAIPKTANPETMLTTASVTSNCIIEKPRWAIGLCFRMVRLLVRVDALITPPVRGLRRFGKTFPWSRVQRLCQRPRSEEHTSELQSQSNLVCRLLLE